MSCCLYWVILEERLSVRVLATAVDDKYNNDLSTDIQHLFIVGSSCHAEDVPSVSDFVSNPMTHVRIYGGNRFCYPCPYFFQTCMKRCNKIFVFLTYPLTERSRGVKSGDRGGHAIIPPRPNQGTICRVTRENHTE